MSSSTSCIFGHLYLRSLFSIKKPSHFHEIRTLSAFPNPARLRRLSSMRATKTQLNGTEVYLSGIMAKYDHFRNRHYHARWWWYQCHFISTLFGFHFDIFKRFLWGSLWISVDLITTNMHVRWAVSVFLVQCGCQNYYHYRQKCKKEIPQLHPVKVLDSLGRTHWRLPNRFQVYRTPQTHD